jgi:hypothetical protein
LELSFADPSRLHDANAMSVLLAFNNSREM